MLLHEDVPLGLTLFDQLVALVDCLLKLLDKQVFRVLLYELVEFHLGLYVSSQ